MKQRLIILMIFILMSCSKSHEEKVILYNFPQDIKQAQIEIVSSLSGNQPIQPIGVQLKARATLRERELSRAYLIELLKNLSLQPIEQNYRQKNINPFVDILIGPFKGTNIYGILPATVNTNQYIILGAHYDTARDCPGANDNASAISLLYGVAKKISEIPSREVNVLIVFFDQEEEDLIGSKAFARYIKKNEYDILSVHTFDQIAWDKDQDNAIELELPTAELEEIYKEQGLKLDIPIHTTKVNSTDHQSFRDIGFNAVGITEEFVNKDTSPYKDTPEDTFETVNFDYVESTTNLVYEVIKTLVTKTKGDGY
ncbi:M28 family metallopeptidase [Algoriphagus machipongonensis]|uniref:Peptidase, M28 family n=1 Tax=Algoriphagus machipongonensis TaxID=388413 RepID=E2RUF5_9BACT|nr:M28 family peptidase [Algoriphagus machipongonensis]EFQ79257.1 peptidase, M28 family [Algoriphagus machipongonensis]